MVTNRTRRSALAGAALLVAACGGSSTAGDTTAVPTTATIGADSTTTISTGSTATTINTGSTTTIAVGTVVVDVPPPVDATVEAWAAHVAEIHLAERSAAGELLATGIADVTIDDVEGNVAYCRAEADLRAAFDAVMPESYGTDPLVAEYYLPMLDARQQRTAGQVEACESLAATPDASPERVFEMFDTVNRLNNDFIASCSSLQAVFFDFFLVELDCLAGSIGDQSQPPDAIEGGAVRDDVVATDGPTGGPQAGFTLLPAGIHSFDWFPAPFELTTDQDLLVIAGDEYVNITQADDGDSFFIAAPSVANDPDDLGGFELGGAVPWPTELDGWIAAMPLLVEGVTDIDLGGATWRHWVLALDGDRAPAPEGEPLVALWSSGSFGAELVFGFELRHVYELPDSGLVATWNDPGFDAEASAATVRWVEGVLAGLRAV